MNFCLKTKEAYFRILSNARVSLVMREVSHVWRNHIYAIGLYVLVHTYERLLQYETMILNQSPDCLEDTSRRFSIGLFSQIKQNRKGTLLMAIL